ncbi:MAG: sugar phosphate isomerase/epimerase [Treponema sp.]|nr:sugar phosphate isomerase/epimerase [Treponema sp.]
MSFSTPKLTLREALDAAKRFGYDGFEPRLESGHAHGVETGASAAFLKEAEAMARERGLEFACIATSCRLADPSVKSGQIDAGKRAVDLARALNCRAIRVFGGKIPDGLSRDKAAELMAGSAAELASYAKGAGVAVCIETHDDWCDPADVAAVAKKSGAFVNWDIMHTLLSARYTAERSFELLKPYIRHVHVHDGYREGKNLLFTPIGKGKVDHAAPVSLLKKAGYDGFISGEWIDWEDGGIHLPRELALLKALEE